MESLKTKTVTQFGIAQFTNVSHLTRAHTLQCLAGYFFFLDWMKLVFQVYVAEVP
jgi:hypothetical protein